MKERAMALHRSVARSRPHTSLPATPPADAAPPRTNSRGRVLKNCAIATRTALHTPSRRHAPMSPPNAATRAHASGRETARSTAKVSQSLAVAAAGCRATLLDLVARIGDVRGSLFMRRSRPRDRPMGVCRAEAVKRVGSLPWFGLTFPENIVFWRVALCLLGFPPFATHIAAPVPICTHSRSTTPCVECTSPSHRDDTNSVKA